MSNLQSNGPRKGPPPALKRAARAVKSRHPLAKARRDGGRGVREPGAADTAIVPPASQNFQQKPLPSTPPTPSDPIQPTPNPPHIIESVAVSSHPAASVALTREDKWRAAGDICATITGIPVNPRMLLILLPGGKRGRAVIHPVDRLRFFVRKPIWVRPEGNGGEVYRVVGKYSRWGIRHS